MGSRERLEAWLSADEEWPPVLDKPLSKALADDDDDLGRSFEGMRAERRRVGRLLLELGVKIDALTSRRL
jgi:hypothetical protein